MATEFDSLPLFAQTETPIAASPQRVAQAPAPPQEPIAVARPLSVEEADALRRGEPMATEEGHRQAAMRWMEEHPDGIALFETLALQAAEHRKKFGVKALAERVRWEYMITKSDDDWRINNSYVSYIARELVRRHPSLAEHIEFRRASGE